MSGIELKYAPRKCEHFVCGECNISLREKSCGIDCDICDTYHYYKQLQAKSDRVEVLDENI